MRVRPPPRAPVRYPSAEFGKLFFRARRRIPNGTTKCWFAAVSRVRLVDAKDMRAAAFYLGFGFEPTAEDAMILYLPLGNG